MSSLAIINPVSRLSSSLSKHPQLVDVGSPQSRYKTIRDAISKGCTHIRLMRNEAVFSDLTLRDNTDYIIEIPPNVTLSLVKSVIRGSTSSLTIRKCEGANPSQTQPQIDITSSDSDTATFLVSEFIMKDIFMNATGSELSIVNGAHIYWQRCYITTNSSGVENACILPGRARLDMCQFVDASNTPFWIIGNSSERMAISCCMFNSGDNAEAQVRFENTTSVFIRDSFFTKVRVGSIASGTRWDNCSFTDCTMASLDFGNSYVGSNTIFSGCSISIKETATFIGTDVSFRDCDIITATDKSVLITGLRSSFINCRFDFKGDSGSLIIGQGDAYITGCRPLNGSGGSNVNISGNTFDSKVFANVIVLTDGGTDTYAVGNTDPS